MRILHSLLFHARYARFVMSRVMLRQQQCRHKVRQHKFFQHCNKICVPRQAWKVCFEFTDLNILQCIVRLPSPNLLRVCSVKGTKASCRGGALEAYLTKLLDEHTNPGICSRGFDTVICSINSFSVLLESWQGPYVGIFLVVAWLMFWTGWIMCCATE